MLKYLAGQLIQYLKEGVVCRKGRLVASSWIANALPTVSLHWERERWIHYSNYYIQFSSSYNALKIYICVSVKTPTHFVV